MTHPHSAFGAPHAAASYAENARRNVPGLGDLHRMVMLLLGRLPHTADSVEWEGWRFEVVDLDGKRVDKVLAARLAEHDGQQVKE